MSNLQVHNSFEPYYAGRNTDVSKWTVRKKTGDRIDPVKVEHGADAKPDPKADKGSERA